MRKIVCPFRLPTIFGLQGFDKIAVPCIVIVTTSVEPRPFGVFVTTRQTCERARIETIVSPSRLCSSFEPFRGTKARVSLTSFGGVYFTRLSMELHTIAPLPDSVGGCNSLVGIHDFKKPLLRTVDTRLKKIKAEV